MPRTINILFLAAEAEPFVKVGGLGDAAGALPRALRALSTDEIKIDVRLVLPMHSVVHAETRPLASYSLKRGDSQLAVEAHTTTLDGMPVYFINGEPIRSSGSVYSSDHKLDAEKYAFFSLAALELPRHIGWDVDIVHCNDWHTALAAYGNLVKRWDEGTRRVASIINVHNLPQMGPDISEIVNAYELPHAQTDLPEWARILPMPLGLWASDAIVAISPSYAQEILTPEYGYGLQDFLLARKETLHGILNGMDAQSFNPEDDPAIGVNYSIETLMQRPKNKMVLQERLRLPVENQVPLLGMVTRMNAQKGFDIALKSLTGLLKTNIQIAILGTGDPKLEEEALKLQELFPKKIKVETRYDTGLARQIYAGADMFIMPSRYEPCGLSQMHAMRYGCVPIARAISGLKDSIENNETGFLFQKETALSLSATIRKAIKAYGNHEQWEKLQHAGMLKDFSWQASAAEWLKLYLSIIHNKDVQGA